MKYLILVVAVMLFVSCQESAVEHGQEPGHTTVQSPGRMHNGILAQYEKRRPIGPGKPIAMKQMVIYIAEAAESVMRENDMLLADNPYRIIWETLILFRRIEDATGLTFSRELSKRDLMVLTEELSRLGVIGQPEATQLAAMLIGPQPQKTVATYAENTQNGRGPVFLFADIYKESSIYWGSICDCCPNCAHPKNVVLVDAIGGLIGNFIGGGAGAIIGAAALSISFIDEANNMNTHPCGYPPFADC